MRKLKRNSILKFSNSIELLGLKYFNIYNLSNKVVQKFLYKFEFLLFLQLKRMKFKEQDYFLFLFEKTKNNLYFKKKKKIHFYYNKSFFQKFNFYFLNSDKEKYFSFSIFNMIANSNRSFSNFLQNKSLSFKNKYLNGKSFKSNLYLNFFSKKLKSIYKLRNLNKNHKSFKIYFSIEKKKSFINLKSKNLLLKNLTKKSIIQLRYFFGFFKYKHFYKFLINFNTKNRLFSLSLLHTFECRLEFCLMRLNLVSSTYFARQYIRSKKILINFKLKENCFYILKKGDIISINPCIFFYQFFIIKFLFLKKLIPFFNPNYFEFDYRLLMGIFLFYPKLYELQQLFLKKVNSLNF